MPENIAGYKAAEKYASQVRKDEEKLRQKASETSGQTWDELTSREKIGLKRVLGIPLKRKIPPEAKEFLAHTRFDPKTQKKAHGGYIKKYAKGGGVRKAR